VVLRALRAKEKLAYIGISLLPSILLGFKHGFVLGELWHVASFYKYTLAVIALLFLYSRRWLDVVLLSIPFVCIFNCVSMVDYFYKLSLFPVNNPERLASMQLSKEFLPSQNN